MGIFGGGKARDEKSFQDKDKEEQQQPTPPPTKNDNSKPKQSFKKEMVNGGSKKEGKRKPKRVNKKTVLSKEDHGWDNDKPVEQSESTPSNNDNTKPIKTEDFVEKNKVKSKKSSH